jgi:hypothetical protein
MATIKRKIHTALTIFIAMVWIVNGFFCKVLDLVPRHELIVARILGNEHSRAITLFIGLSEIGMAIWIVSGVKTHLNAIVQIGVVAVMNVLEFVLAPDLLLWGKLNLFFAFLLILVIGCNEFYLNKTNFKNNNMLSFLKNHPFAVEAFFESSLVITFAVPKEQLKNLIPECLALDTFKDKWAFIAVAMVQTRGLRPKGFPKFTGNDFFLIGYRVFVRYTNNAGKSLRGLYILKSETDKKRMEFMGNIFTHYNYTTTDITQTDRNNVKEIRSGKSNFEITIDNAEGEVSLPATSPFADWKEARRFAGPLPFTFTYNAGKKEVLTIEGIRQNWTPQPVKVIDYRFSFLNSLHLENAVLANAFIIRNIPYYWKKGKLEQWNKKEESSRAS